MNINKENYRVFEKSFFIYQNKGGVQTQNTEQSDKPEKLDADKASKDFEENFLKGIEIPKTTDPKEIRLFVNTTFAEKFGPDKYETEIRDFIQKHKINGNTDQMVKDARTRYETFYEAARTRFYEKTIDRAKAYEELKNSITGATRSGLQLLMHDVRSRVEAVLATPGLKNVPPPAEKGNRWPYKIPIAGPVFKSADIPIISRVIDSKQYRDYKEFQYQTTLKFKGFIKALNKQYFESALEANKLNDYGKGQYEKLAQTFKNGVEEHMLRQLESIYASSPDAETLKKNLEALSDGLALSYALYDTNQDGVLDLRELTKLNNDTRQYIDLLRLINSTEDEGELGKKLEALSFFNRDIWKNAASKTVEQLIEEVPRNGSEAQFINAVKKLTSSAKNMSFGEAANEFRSVMKKRAETGVKETIKTFREFNKDVNGARVEILNMDDINPPSIRGLVYIQRGLIISGRLEPPNIDDKIVAEFMGPDLARRTRLLNDPVRRKDLFLAIQNIKEHYPKIYSSKYMRAVPKKASDIVTNEAHPDKPTNHDLIARHLAMLSLAKEAEWVVNNLDKSNDFKGKKLSKELDDTEAEKTPPKINRKFRSVDTLYKVGYVSEAERGGFNGRDITLGALKVWAGMTLVINYMTATKKLGFLKGAEAMVTNPYFLGGAAAIYGIDKYQKNPAVKNYLFHDAGGQERIATHLSLSSITRAVGRPHVLAFITDGGEFNAMKSMFKDPNEGVSKVNKLITNAEKRRVKEKKKEAVLTKKDLEDNLKDHPEIWSQLPNTGNDRTRFLFYKTFLTTNKRNIRELQANCEKWI